MLKTCKECGIEKPLSDFYAHTKTYDLLNYRCIPCQNAYNREYNLQRALERIDPVVLMTFHEAPTQDRLLRFARKIERTDTCWRWIGNCHPDSGYGRMWFDRHDDRSAHRLAYEWSGHTIPEGLTIDHLCRNRWCVNPDHLEAVSRGENTLRGDSPFSINARKTHCWRGHEFTPENTMTYNRMRHCRECGRIRKRERRAAKKGTDRARPLGVE